MYKSVATLAIAASLFSGLFTLPALARPSGAGHGAHHPNPAQSQTQAAETPAMPGMRQGMGHGMGHHMSQGGGMMNCPMMTGGMQMGAPTGDQSAASLALNAVNEKMHRDMAIAFTGNPDADFVAAMIAHHQGAIDMAKVVKAFGEDEQIRTLADAIINAQEDEIAMMREWQSRNVSR